MQKRLLLLLGLFACGGTETSGLGPAAPGPQDAPPVIGEPEPSSPPPEVPPEVPEPEPLDRIVFRGADTTALVFSADGRRLAFVEIKDSLRGDLYLYDLPSNELRFISSDVVAVLPYDPVVLRDDGEAVIFRRTEPEVEGYDWIYESPLYHARWDDPAPVQIDAHTLRGAYRFAGDAVVYGKRRPSQQLMLYREGGPALRLDEPVQASVYGRAPENFVYDPGTEQLVYVHRRAHDFGGLHAADLVSGSTRSLGADVLYGTSRFLSAGVLETVIEVAWDDHRLARIDLRSGAVTRTGSGEGFVRSADLRWAAFFREEALWVHDWHTGTERSFGVVGERVELGFHGKYLTFAGAQRKLGVIDLETGTVRLSQRILGAAWHGMERSVQPMGDELVFLEGHCDEPGRSGLVAFDPATGVERELGNGPVCAPPVVIGGDRSLLYLAGAFEGPKRLERWILDENRAVIEARNAVFEPQLSGSGSHAIWSIDGGPTPNRVRFRVVNVATGASRDLLTTPQIAWLGPMSAKHVAWVSLEGQERTLHVSALP